MSISQVVQKEKIIIRNKILNLLRKQREEDRRKKSLVVLDKLFSLPEFQKSQTILFYASCDGEVDTFEIMQQAQQVGKTIALPIINLQEKKITPALIGNLEEDLEYGHYGIKEPKKDATKFVDIQDIDMILVPGIAFDKQNNRLGRGAGYYDRFLKELSPHIFSVGLAFDFQIVDRLPIQNNDIPVSKVVTN